MPGTRERVIEVLADRRRRAVERRRIVDPAAPPVHGVRGAQLVPRALVPLRVRHAARRLHHRDGPLVERGERDHAGRETQQRALRDILLARPLPLGDDEPNHPRRGRDESRDVGEERRPARSSGKLRTLAGHERNVNTGVPVSTFNLADLFELVADAAPDRKAIVAGDRRLTYAQLDERANRLAHHLQSLGVGEGDYVGLQLLNGTEYAEGMLACFKIRAVPVNVNFRYVTDELQHLFDDADLVVIIATAVRRPRRGDRSDLPKLRDVIVVEDGLRGAGLARIALRRCARGRDFGPRRALGDDLYCAYTGGTTGLPKGVIWRHEDIFFAGMGGGDVFHAGNYVKTPEELVERIPDPGLVALATPPFMHVSAHWLLFSRACSAAARWSSRRRAASTRSRSGSSSATRGVNMLIIVGDAMARPLADELEANRDAYDTSSLARRRIGRRGAVGVDEGAARERCCRRR